ncbi:hypothetical protein Pssp01_39440 [Pseudomonas sp. NBRC 100443]|nr:hypothetical protein Pssp01_39440 [Pseudomonas sp. NBRC 100443]
MQKSTLTPALSRRERGPFGVGGESGVILGLLYPPSAVPPGRSAWSVGPIADGVRSYGRASLEP